MENVPFSAVIVLFSAPVPLFLIFTSAPGMTPPDESTTVPDNDVRKLPCANALVAARATRNKRGKDGSNQPDSHQILRRYCNETGGVACRL
jgi:hypothetical protein